MCHDLRVAREGLTTAFWSYAHSDDDGLDGQIARLRDAVDHAFQRHSGEALESFFDRDSLVWGTEWRSKITDTISGTTFFIAVLSPSYLKSPNCRDEFNQFRKAAENSDLGKFLLPILWVPTHPDTDEEREVSRAAEAHQYIPWTETRKLGESEPEYKRLIDQMGERLADVARELNNRPERIDPAAIRATIEVSSDGTASPVFPPVYPAGANTDAGLVELLEEAGNQAQALGGNIGAAFSVINRMTREVSSQSVGPEVPAQQRLLALKQVANEITPYADEFEQKARAAEESARLMNKSAFTAFDLMENLGAPMTVKPDEAETLRPLLNAIIEKLSATPKMRSRMSMMGRLSRDLRVPFATIERGFDSLDAVATLVAEFSQLLDRGQEGSPLQQEPS